MIKMDCRQRISGRACADSYSKTYPHFQVAGTNSKSCDLSHRCGDCWPGRLEAEVPSQQQPVTRTAINLPPGQQLAGLDNGPAVALSPDGTQLAYVATQGGMQQLYLRAMDSLEARPIPGTEGGSQPFLFARWPMGRIFRGRNPEEGVGERRSGGDSRRSCKPPRGQLGQPGNNHLCPDNISVLQQVPDAGGASQPLTRLEKGEASRELAGLLARRQDSTLCWGNDWTEFH